MLVGPESREKLRWGIHTISFVFSILNATHALLLYQVEIVHNIYGSCAGAGSGEFDVYRAGKRREEMRLENLEKRDQALAKAAEFEAKITGNKRAAEVWRAYILFCTA